MVTRAVHMDVPAYVSRALDVLERAGYEAWCVGGCVRDALLERPVHDYDIATSSPWQDTKRVFEAAGYRTYDVGAKHGTITVLIDDNALEITTYRTDGAYSDGRHPDTVEFVNSIEEDLARRDFTINALAYHPERGLLDCFGGLDDLQNGIIRAVGEPTKRFREDALRILRGCRFISQLGFSLEADTRQGMWMCKGLVLRVSKERITHELDELLLGDYVHDALIETVDIISVVLPELLACKDFNQHSPHHVYDVLEHTARVVQEVPATRLARWVALFHDIGKPGCFYLDNGRGHFFGHPELSAQMAKGIMDRLLMSPAFQTRVLMLVRMHDEVISAKPRAVKRALARLDGNTDLFKTLCDIKRADALAQAPSSAPRVQLADDLKRVLADVLAAEEAFSLAQLAINGSDILALGVAEGPAVGALLQQALDAVIDELVPNEREALLEFVKNASL